MGTAISSPAKIDSISPLKIGDTIPGWLWDFPLQVVNDPKEKAITTLGDYRGKLIILDFWATWCSGCVAMLPKQAGLQREFGDDCQFISITRESVATVRRFLERNPMPTGLLPDALVSDDTVLTQLMPHRLLPHYAWIDPAGIVLGFTDSRAVNATNLDRYRTGNALHLPTKSDYLGSVSRFDGKSLHLNGAPVDSTLLGLSIMTAHRPEYKATFNHYDLENGHRLLLVNTALINLYRIAFGGERYFPRLDYPQVGYPLNRVVSAIGQPDDKTDDQYCYELLVQGQDANALCKTMQTDLTRMFPYRAGMETRKTRCLLLTGDVTASAGAATDTIFSHNALRWVLHNQPVSRLVALLDLYLGVSGHIVLADLPDDTPPISVELHGRMTDYDTVKEQLARYGLYLKPAEREIELLVIRQPVSTTINP